MNLLLTASPVGALPEGLLTLGQLQIIYVASKIGGELP